MDEQIRFREESASIRQLLFQATEILVRSGVPEARREAGSLLAHVLNSDRTHLISNSDELIDDKKVKTFRDDVERRAAGEPLQYITGVQDFFGLEFKVTPDVLIPRPETELLVEVALDLLRRAPQKTPLICDVGTGSGCIAISLLHMMPSARALGIDLSSAAIQIAEMNGIQHRVGDRISFAVSDCFNALKDPIPQFDMIVSNPPYVSAAAMRGLQREVRDHEPLIALSPGVDGLLIIRRLLEQSPVYLESSGYLVLEIGFDQGQAVREMIKQDIWRILDIHPDLQGIPRIVALQKKSS